VWLCVPQEPVVDWAGAGQAKQKYAGKDLASIT
jgi:hypothetical protein